MSASWKSIVVTFTLFLLPASGMAMAANYPAALAREVAQYPQAELDYVNEAPDTATAVFNAAVTAEQVVSYYRGVLAGRGWRETAQLTIGDAHALEFSRDGEVISINIVTTGGGTTVALTLNP